jgi:hypothetical protein
MFRQLQDFRHARSLVEAIGFYLVYAITGLIGIVTLSMVVGQVNGDFGFEQGVILGTVVAAVISLGLSLTILRAKGLLGHYGYLTVAILSAAAAAAGGLLLSMILIAFLTTRQPAETKQVATA